MPKQSSRKKSQPGQAKGKAITPPASQRSAARATTAPAAQRPAARAETAPAAQRPAARAETVPASAAQRREQQRQQRQATTQRPQQQQRNRRKVQRKANTGMWVTIGVVVAAIVVVIGVFIYLATRPSGTSSSNGNTYPVSPVDPTVLQQITNVDPSVLAAVETGPSGKVTKPTKLSFTTPLTGPSGKPEVFYYGAEYCPYCAAERWGMIVALSRFGTFHNLHQESSASNDSYPNTPTFSFYQSSYTSKYIDFVPLEVESYNGTTLQTPSADQQQIISSLNPGGSFPFIDIGNKYSVTGASYDPQVLANLDWQSVAGSLSNASNPVTQDILGTANYLTATICEATNQQPASVCTAAPIPSVEAALNGSTGSNGGLGMAMSAPVAVVRRSEG